MASQVRRLLQDGPSSILPTCRKIVRKQFSLILIDSSLANVTADSLALCETVDGIVLVVEAEQTRSAVAKKVRDQILMQEGNLLGMVFTKRHLYIPESLYKFI